MQADTGQYTLESITRYESIFGRDFVSTGGLETTQWLLEGVPLQRNLRVLDAGCGLGGSAFYLSRQFDAQVLGIDILPQMIEEARRRAADYGCPQVEFLQGDLLNVDLPEGHFDLVYSRDAFLHISEKDQLFQRLLGCLKPGGLLFFTDYARGEQAPSQDFAAYQASNNYDLHTPEQYGKLVAHAGFGQVEVRDLSEEFVQILREEAARVAALGTEALSPEDREYLLARWQRKIQFCQDGDMRWCCIQATA